MALEGGLGIRTETHEGPFGRDSGNAVYLPVEGIRWTRCCLAARTDANDTPLQSRLRVWVDGTEYATAHAEHELIRSGRTGVFSHWTDAVRLALPDRQANDETASVRLAYPLQIPNRTLSLALIATTAVALAAVLAGVLYRVATHALRRGWTHLVSVGRTPCWVAILAALRRRLVLAALRRRRRLVSVLLAAAFLATLGLECGAWQRTQVIPGPFAAESTSKMLFVPVDRGSRLAWLLAPRGDVQAEATRSTLRFAVDGQPYTEPHASHGPIRDGAVGLYSHWGDEVRFALPPGVANGSDTRVTLTYPLQLAAPWMSFALLAASALLWVIVERPWITRDRVARLLRWPLLVSIGFVGVLAALTGLYAAATAIAWARGWALPSTEPIVGSAVVRWLAMAEPHGPELVLGLALVGTLAGWTASLCRIDQGANEARVLRLLGMVGAAILVALLVFSASAQWAGLWRQGDLSSAAIAGLLPFSDANGYYADANDVVNDGLFGPMGSRRPLAQTFRTTLMALGGYSYAAMVVVQSLFLGLAIFFAARAVARWRGLWAGLAFAAMTYAVAREFHATTLTEPLGLFWGLCAIPPLVQALRHRSARHAVLATGLLTVALLTRMGSMFTIPALLLWVVLCFGDTRAAKLRIGVAALAVVLGVAALNSATAKLYTRDSGMVGSNFSYTLCGLTIGGTWSDCQQRYGDEIPKAEQNDERAIVRLMYRKAYENFVAHPGTFFARLFDAASAFTQVLPEILTQGYLAVPLLFQSGLLVLELLAGIGLLRLVLRMPRHEVAFWLLFWSSAIVSAGFVFFDDGKRVMIAIYPVASLFLASGLHTARAPQSVSVRTFAARASTGALATATLLLVCLVTPFIEHRFFRPSVYLTPEFAELSKKDRNAGEQFAFGGARMTGLLVVADGEPLRKDVPTLHVSDFANIVRQSGIEIYQGLVTPVPPPLPFAFVESPDLVPGDPTTYKFIVPPDVLLRKDVPAWRFDTTSFSKMPNSGSYWFMVTRADPLNTRAPLSAVAR